MKILMLVNWKIKYCKEIPDNMQSPDYYVPGEPYWFFKYFEDKNVQIDVEDMHTFPALEKFEKNKLRFYVWQTLRVLPKLNKYDVVLSHGMQSGIVLCLLRRIFGKGKYKHIVFDIGAFNSAKESGSALKLMQFASKSLDGVIYHTKSQIAYYEKCHPWLMDKSRFIAFGTDTDFFAEYNQEFAGEKGDPYILCAGYHQRDWNTLIRAYFESSRKCKLCLLGTPGKDILNLIDELKLGDDVQIMAPLGIDGFKDRISGAEFCVLPLEDMNFSFGQMTLLQQMAMGKAVLAANVPSIQAYLDNNAVRFYASGNVEDLRKELDFMMENADICQEMGARASSVVKEKYNEEIMAKQIEEFIGTVADL